MDRIKDYKELKKRLTIQSEIDYRDFTTKLTPTKYPILGVRIPKIRELSKLVPKEDIDTFLRVRPNSFEEVLFRGFLICRLPYEEMAGWFDSQVNLIDNWASCDMFCSALRPVIKKHLDEFLEEKIDPLLLDTNEFNVRVGLVILKCSYVEKNYLDVIFKQTEKLAKREEYYIKMAISWLLAECFIKFPDETLPYLNNTNLSKWTFNKTISKICDSYRVKPEIKNILRKMRK